MITAAEHDNWREVSLELAKRVPFGEGSGNGPLLAAVTRVHDASGVADAAPAAVGQGTTVRVFPWGFHIQIDHDTLERVLDAADTVNELVLSIGGSIPSPAQPWIALIALFVAGAHAALRALDRGQGIYISMSWFAQGIFVPTSV